MSKNDQNINLLSVYVINGEDELKRQTVLKRLRARIATLGDLAFNSDTFDGQSASGVNIVSACNTLPFMSDVRLVVVDNADQLKKADSEQIISYLDNPSPTTVLALVANKLAKNSRLYKAAIAIDSKALIDCSLMKRSELPKAVVGIAKQYGVTLSIPAAQKLIELIGENTVSIDAELQKIAVGCIDSATIGPKEIESLVSRRVEAKPWDLTDALSRRDAHACFEVLSRLDSVSEYVLLAQCTTRIRELICAQSLIKRGEPQMLANVLHLPPWRVRDHINYAKNFTSEELRAALVNSCNTEKAMKSGASPRIAFETWLFSALS